MIRNNNDRIRGVFHNGTEVKRAWYNNQRVYTKSGLVAPTVSQALEILRPVFPLSTNKGGGEVRREGDPLEYEQLGGSNAYPGLRTRLTWGISNEVTSQVLNPGNRVLTHDQRLIEFAHPSTRQAYAVVATNPEGSRTLSLAQYNFSSSTEPTLELVAGGVTDSRNVPFTQSQVGRLELKIRTDGIISHVFVTPRGVSDQGGRRELNLDPNRGRIRYGLVASATVGFNPGAFVHDGQSYTFTDSGQGYFNPRFRVEVHLENSSKVLDVDNVVILR